MKQTPTLVKTSNEPNLLKPHGTGGTLWFILRSHASAAPNARGLQRCNIQPDRTGVRGN
jgi:hypothetical protein